MSTTPLYATQQVLQLVLQPKPELGLKQNYAVAQRFRTKVIQSHY